MGKKTIAIGSDHAGFELKTALLKQIADMGHFSMDFGTNGPDSVDYPDFAYKVASAVASGKASLGVVVCGSGHGVAIAANRNPAIRAILARTEEDAKLGREHNNANVLALGGRMTGPDAAQAILKKFLETEFAGGRHAPRVQKLSVPPLT